MANGQTDTASSLLPTMQSLQSLLPQQPSDQQQPAQTTDQVKYQPIAEDPQPLDIVPAVPLFKGGSPVGARPSSWGLNVGTPEDVRNVDAYVKAGGDINRIPIMDQLGIALAKDPDFFPKNPAAFYDYVTKPLQQQKEGDSNLSNLIKQGWHGVGDIFQNLWAAINNAGEQEMDNGQLMFRKMTGMTHGQDYQDLLQRLAGEKATEAHAVAQAVTSGANLTIDVGNTIAQGTKPIAKLFAHDPQSQDQIDRAYSQLLLSKGVKQSKLYDLGQTVQQTAAQAYKITGVGADLGQKMQTATPDPKAAAGMEMIYNPQNWFGLGEGAAAVGAVRVLNFERGLEAAENLAGANAKKAAFDITQIQPRNPELSAADPAYIPTRNLQSKLAPGARAATQDVTDAQQVLNSRLTTLGKTAGDPGTVTTFAANALQATGGAIQKGANIIRDGPSWIAGKLSMGYEPLKNLIEDGIHKYIFGFALHHLGPLGGAIEAGIEHLPAIADTVGNLPKIMGQELLYADNTIPYWTRVAQQTKMMPRGLASFLDSPLVQSATDIGRATALTAGTNAVIGGLAGGPAGAVGGLLQGGIFGMAGAGLGQWQRFRNPNQYLLAARSDWKRYSDLLSPPERQNFSQLSPTNQLIIAQNAMHFPGLRIDYSNDPNGPRGMHYVDQGGASHIQVNVANPGSAIRGIAAHELTHAATHSGMLPPLYDTLFGNPNTGEIGQFTALGADGKPIGIDPATGRYQPNQIFQNLKSQYVNALAQSGVPTAHLNDFNIAREIYAEHGVDYLLSGGAVLDSNSAFRPGLYSQSALKTALAKMGYTFDESGRMIGAPGGNVTGTGLFNDLQRIPGLQNFAQAYFTKQWKEGLMASEDSPTHEFTKRDLQNPNTSETWLNNAPEIMRKADGTAMRDPNTGLPIMRTAREVKQYNAGFADSLRKGLDSMPEDQRMDLGYRKTVDEKGRPNIFTRYLPDNVLDSLAATNQYNPHQIASLRLLSRVLADKGNPGMEMRMFYRTATTPKKGYGTFAGGEKLAVPYGFEITHDNNVNIKSVDFNQLNGNYLKVRTREPFKSLWQSPDEFTQDAHTYFTNHKEGQPGATAIGAQKRDAINALAGFGTALQAESNPLVDQMPGSVRPIIKSYAIDRANQISATGAVRPFVSEEQYRRMNMNYLPGAEGEYLPRAAGAQTAPAPPPDQTAIPVTMRTTSTGKTVEEKFDYGISSAPLVADKQPPSTLSKDNNFGHVDFLSKPDQQRLTHLDKVSAVTDYADKLVDEFGKWKDNKDVMTAKNWYDAVRKDLKKGFGAHAELFAQLLAATSPQQGVVQNWEDALGAYKQFRLGAYDNAIGEFQRTGKITEDMKPRKPDGAKFGLNSDAVLKVLAGTWLDSVEGPKTANFFDNLFQRGTSATIDKWAARTMRRQGFDGVEGAPAQWRLTPPSEKGVSNLDFALSQQAFQQAADRLNMKPHQLQAIMWYAEKHLWAQRGWAKGGAQAAKASYLPMLKAYAAAPHLPVVR